MSEFGALTALDKVVEYLRVAWTEILGAPSNSANDAAADLIMKAWPAARDARSLLATLPANEEAKTPAPLPTTLAEDIKRARELSKSQFTGSFSRQILDILEKIERELAIQAEQLIAHDESLKTHEGDLTGLFNGRIVPGLPMPFQPVTPYVPPYIVPYQPNTGTPLPPPTITCQNDSANDATGTSWGIGEHPEGPPGSWRDK